MSCVLCNQAMKLVNYIFVSCPYRTIIWSLSPWQILTNSLVIVTPSDLVKYVIFPQWYLKIPATGLHKFNLFATILFDIIWRFRHQTIFVEHIPNPTKVAKRIIKKKKDYPDNLSALSFLVSYINLKLMPVSSTFRLSEGQLQCYHTTPCFYHCYWASITAAGC